MIRYFKEALTTHNALAVIKRLNDVLEAGADDVFISIEELPHSAGQYIALNYKREETSEEVLEREALVIGSKMKE